MRLERTELAVRIDVAHHDLSIHRIDQRSARAADLDFASRERDGPRKLDVRHAAVLGAEQDLGVVVAIPDADDGLDVRPAVDHGAFQHLQRLIDEVGAPVREQAAALGGERHPVVAPAVADEPVELDRLDLAQKATLHQRRRLLKRSLEPAVEPEEQPPRVSVGRFDERVHLSRVQRAGLLHNDVFAGVQRPNGHGRVIRMPGGDGNQVDIRILEQAVEIRMNRRLCKCGRQISTAGFIHVATGRDRKKFREFGQLVRLHALSCPSKADDSHAKRIAHFGVPFMDDGGTGYPVPKAD